MMGLGYQNSYRAKDPVEVVEHGNIVGASHV